MFIDREFIKNLFAQGSDMCANMAPLKGCKIFRGLWSINMSLLRSEELPNNPCQLVDCGYAALLRLSGTKR
jgi:hypothetical protein